MHRLLIPGVLLLGAALIVPIVAGADRGGQSYNRRYYENRRYFDRDSRDYHVWNNQEDRAYRFYLKDQRREYREWRNVRGPGHLEYFRWRHSHPDSMIFVVK